MHYRWKTGMLAWVLFRITGLALVGYLAMHVIVISNLHDPAKFNQTMGFLGSWKFRLLEIGLFLVVLYHSMNGVRIFLVDFFNGSQHQARIFWILAAVGVILFAAGTYPMLSHALYWKDHQGVPSVTAVTTSPPGDPQAAGKCPVYHGGAVANAASSCQMGSDASCNHAKTASAKGDCCGKGASHD